MSVKPIRARARRLAIQKWEKRLPPPVSLFRSGFPEEEHEDLFILVELCFSSEASIWPVKTKEETILLRITFPTDHRTSWYTDNLKQSKYTPFLLPEKVAF